MASESVVEVSILSSEFEGAWDQFVSESKDASVMHYSGWRNILESTFSVEPFYLLAVRLADRKIVAILPMYKSESIFGNNELVSMHGGIIALDKSCQNELFQKAKEIAESKNSQFITLKAQEGEAFESCETTDAVTSRVDLAGGSSRRWDLLTSNTRRKIRKSQKNGFTVEVESQIPDAFHAIYSRRMLELGTPTTGPELFSSMTENLQGKLKFFGVYFQRRLVGGMVVLHDTEKAQSLYVAVDSRELSKYPVYLLYWRAIESMCESNIMTFDLGRSVLGSGNHSFKQQWKGADVLLTNYHYCVGVDSVENVDLHRESSFKQKVWRWLPLSVANFLGPCLRKQLPFG